MATANRKARKASGEKFVRVPKVGTPLEERAEFNRMVPGASGTKFFGKLVPVSAKRLARALKDRGIEVEK